MRVGLGVSFLFGSAVAQRSACRPTRTNLCVSVNVFTSETGYYEIAGETGPSPTITLKIGETYTFDQADHTNWMHPIGFAYYPDGAHGATWGGEELDEVEGLGELLYKIDGAETTCEDAGDTGLDCYEPEFFYPRGDWLGKHYAAELTITQEMADRSHGGEIYYFCHIHSKMSGKIVIVNADGSSVTKADGSQIDEPTPLELYAPDVGGDLDRTCGTYGLAEFGECSERYVCGSLDTVFEKCLQAIDCKMHKEMYSATTEDHHDHLAVFMEQMIPHHVNAVNMARLLLKMPDQEFDEDLENILYSIISTQNFQIHQFRNYLGGTVYTPTLECAAAIVGQPCSQNGDCAGLGYCSPNQHECKSLKAQDEYCNAVQRCGPGLSCTASKCI